jgi:hypothetical protein
MNKNTYCHCNNETVIINFLISVLESVNIKNRIAIFSKTELKESAYEKFSNFSCAIIGNIHLISSFKEPDIAKISSVFEQNIFINIASKKREYEIFIFDTNMIKHIRNEIANYRVQLKKISVLLFINFKNNEKKYITTFSLVKKIFSPNVQVLQIEDINSKIKLQKFYTLLFK